MESRGSITTIYKGKKQYIFSILHGLKVGMIGSKNIHSNIMKTPNSDSKQTPGANLAVFTKRGAIQKAQLQFKDKVDNSSLPFVPKIRQKPNALKPLPG